MDGSRKDPSERHHCTQTVKGREMTFDIFGVMVNTYKHPFFFFKKHKYGKDCQDKIECSIVGLNF